MSLILFLGCAAIGTAMTGITIADELLKEEDLKEHITEKTKVYSTIMKNEELLKRALDELGLKVNDESSLKSITTKGEIVFVKNEKDNYDILFSGDFDDEEINTFADEVFRYYASNLQEYTYEKVLNQIRNSDYQLESEEVLDDSSIVLTIEI